VTARIVLIAHGATQAQRQAAFPLDEPIAGPEMAKIAAQRWSCPKAERIWSAPEQRAQQTACALGLTAMLAEELRDCDYGQWHGRAMEQVQAEDPEGILAWLADPAAAPHGGESIEHLIRRIGAWLGGQREVKSTIAVTHPAVIRSAIVHALHIPAQAFWRFDIAPLTVTDLRFSRNVWTVRCVGCSLAMQGEAGNLE
jgi:broad specificity phosphatase PhoE